MFMKPEGFIFSVPKPAKSIALCLTFFLGLADAEYAQTAPTIMQQPQNQTVPVGSQVKFSVSVDGTPPFSYQWHFDSPFYGAPALPVETNSTLTIDAESWRNAGNYSVVVSNLDGSMASIGASLVVYPGTPFVPVWKLVPAPPLAWLNVSLSADGTVMAATSGGSFVYTSTNSGLAWLSNSLASGAINSVAVSPNGNVWAALSSGTCEISTNAGTTWQANTNIYEGDSVAFSPDGSHLFVCGDGLYTSTNLGTSWSSTDGTRDVEIASSGDGKEVLLLGFDGLEMSTNSGTSWFLDLPPSDENDLLRITCSEDGLVITGCYSASGFNMSTNRGENWFYDGLWSANSSCTSVDGSRIVVADFVGRIFFSPDFGTTWTTNLVPNLYYVKSVACSQDGTRVLAYGTGRSGNAIYTAQWPPNLIIQPVGGSLVLSWPAPSTGFVVQQTIDSTLTKWAPVPINPITSNYSNFVTIPASSNASLFRLSGPSF